jgi:hypothetical protein
MTTCKRLPIKILFHGDYLNRSPKSGHRICFPMAPPRTIQTEPRLKLAEWIADRRPLTARHGEPPVAIPFQPRHRTTPNDFGRMGMRRPSELLDWLAGGSSKRLEENHPPLILLSSAYQQSSLSPIEKVAMEKDSKPCCGVQSPPPRSRRDPRRVLAVSARLNLKAGVPSFMVPIDPAWCCR